MSMSTRTENSAAGLLVVIFLGPIILPFWLIAQIATGGRRQRARRMQPARNTARQRRTVAKMHAERVAHEQAWAQYRKDYAAWEKAQRRCLTYTQAAEVERQRQIRLRWERGV